MPKNNTHAESAGFDELRGNIMKKTISIVCCLALLVSCFLWIGCQPKNDDEEDDKKGDNPPVEKAFNPDLEGFGAGDMIYRYFEGYWKTYSISTNIFPIYSLHFPTRNRGYAAGGSGILRYDGVEWTNITPASQTSIYDFIRVIEGFSAVYVLGRATDGSESKLHTYSLENGSWNEFDLNAWTGRDDAIIHDIAYSVNIGIVMLAAYGGAAHMITFNEEGPVIETIYPQTEKSEPVLKTISIVTVDEGVDIWVAGHEILTQGDTDDDDATDDDDSTDDDTTDDDDSTTSDAFSKTSLLPLVMHSEQDEWVRYELSGDCHYQSVDRIVMTSQNHGYASVYCIYSHVLEFDGTGWYETDLPQEKGEDYFIADMSFIDDTVGWAVGHSSYYNEPLMLIHSSEGWEIGRPPIEERENGGTFYAVTMYPTPESDDDDDAADDDDDSADDDDAVDDDDSTDDDDNNDDSTS